MTEAILLIGRPTGMESLVTLAVQSARAIYAFPDVTSAVREGRAANLIIIFQHWPDEYSKVEILQLLESYPLARILVSQSRWSLSDRRTRSHWPAAVCVQMIEAEDRLQRELEVLSGTRPPLAWTAGLDEIFAFDHGGNEDS